jgi:hypothetical protein
VLIVAALASGAVAAIAIAKSENRATRASSPSAEPAMWAAGCPQKGLRFAVRTDILAMAARIRKTEWSGGLAPSVDEIAALTDQAFQGLPEEFRALCGDLIVRVDEFADEETLEELGASRPSSSWACSAASAWPTPASPIPIPSPT